MALKALNSVGGFSVGETPSNVIYPNGDFTGNKANFTGNIAALGLLTDNLYYANGTAWDLQQAAGLTGYVQFNDGNNFAASANFTFNSGTNVLTVNGNIGATRGSFTNIAGEGGNISNIQGANVSGAVASATTAGTVTTAAQPNITSVGTLTGLTVSGVSNLGAVGNVIITGGSSGFYLQTNGSGNLTWAAVPSGNGIANGTSNVSVPAINGNVNTSVAGNANVFVVTGTGVNVAGTLNATGNANVGNIGATRGVFTNIAGEGGNISNIQGANVSGAVASATSATNASALLQNTSTATTVYPTFSTSSANGNSSAVINTGITANLGNASITATTFVGALSGAATTAGSATTAGTVTTAAQPNITSVGTLTSLGVNGTVTAVAFTANTGVFTGNANGLTGIPGANVTGTVPSATSATNASALLQNTSTATTVYPTFSTSSANGNSSAVINTGITANLGNASITATTFVGALSGAATSATTAGTVTTAAQPNITSVGTLTSLGVNGTVTAVAFTANTGVFTGNANGLTGIPGANVTGTVPSATAATNASALLQNTSSATTVYPTFSTSSANGNSSAVINTGITANLGNASITATTFVGALSGAATTAGTVTTAAQPNITSVGTLTGLTVGNVTANTIFGNGTVSATGNVSGGNLTTTGVLSVTGTGVSSIAGNLDMTSNNIINLAAPVNSSDAATKQYVDDVAQGLHTHDSCNAATSTTLAILSGGTITYNNGSSGVGATLTTTGSYTTIDGVTLSNGMRILVKNEANSAHNGIYDRTSSTILTRSIDFDTPTEMAGGDFTFVTAGTLYDNTGWVMTDAVTTVGTSPVDWVQFSGAGTYTAGTGLTLTGSQFSITNTAVTAASYGNGDRVATFTVNNQGQLTLAANAVITANAANLTGTTLNSSIVTSSLTSVGTLGTLTVTGNANVGNLNTAGTVVASTLTSNIATGTAPLTVTSTTRVANLNVATAGVANTVNDAAQPNITSVGTLTSLAVTGNANVGNLNATTAVVASTLTSNVSTGTAPLTVTSTTLVPNLYVARANVTDLISTSAGTGNNFLVFANAATGNVTELTSTGLTANLSNNSITATTFVGALSGAATTAGTVTTNAQPNITSVGTLTSLAVTGNITSGNANLGNLATANFFTGTLVNGTSNAYINGSGGNFLISVGGTANIVEVSASGLGIGNTDIGWGTVTTASTSANQTIAQFNITGVTGVEFLVKGIDATGSKYSVATVTAVTDGTIADYSIFATASIGGSTGSLVVNKTGSNLALQVTPSSSNSTVWTAQYRTI